MRNYTWFGEYTTNKSTLYIIYPFVICEYTKSWDVDLFYSDFLVKGLSDYPAKKWHRFIPQCFPYLKGDAFSKPSLFGIGIYFSNLGCNWECCGSGMFHLGVVRCCKSTDTKKLYRWSDPICSPTYEFWMCDVSPQSVQIFWRKLFHLNRATFIFFGLACVHISRCHTYKH